MKVDIKLFKAPISNNAFSGQVFNGKILLFNNTPAFWRLVQAARHIARECFEMQNPIHAHRRYQKEEFFTRAAVAQKEFNTPPYRAIFAECLSDIGVSVNGCFGDTLGLRIAPPVKTHAGGFRSNVGVHRDTWGAAIQSQINWWMPVWSLTKKRTMGFYPQHWQRPLANTTAQWSFKEFLASRKQATAGKAALYPSAPKALAKPVGKMYPVLPPVGAMLVFSSAHVHTSIPNQTQLTRFSIEIRTVSLDDLRQNRKAPNVDCESKEPLTRLFHSFTDNTRLSEYLQSG